MVLSYKNISLKGFFFDIKINFYKDVNLIIAFRNLKGLSRQFFYIFKIFHNFYNKESFFLNNFINNFKVLKSLNIFFLKILSIFVRIFDIVNLSNLRLYYIRHYRGICVFIGKPSKGQRTWSNSNTIKRCGTLIKLINKKDSWFN